jgi:hypothetical protein
MKLIVLGAMISLRRAVLERLDGIEKRLAARGQLDGQAGRRPGDSEDSDSR